MTYEYECKWCSLTFEAEHPASQPKGATCPECGRHTDHRLIGRTSFVLRGSGWYRTGGY